MNALLDIVKESPMPPRAVCERAMLSRDVRFDGRFFTGVLTTGIFCRPICPARTPSPGNVQFYPTAAAAEEAGFRPCKRCLPETARRLPEWSIGSETVVRALRLIDAGFLNDHCAAELARELGVSARHLGRLFRTQLGTTPLSMARMQRLNLARRLLDGSGMKLADVALQAGFGSVRHFNAEFRRVYRCAPGELRRRAARQNGEIRISLPLRQPYNNDWVMGFLGKRALPGVEEVHDGVYFRSLLLTSGASGWLRAALTEDSLDLMIPCDTSLPVSAIVPRIRRVFDLDADGGALQDFLAADPVLGSWARDCPGIRVPGAWDGFETAVRAILGQQVSVERARRLAEAMVGRYGEGAFPEPEQLVHADVAELGMPGARGAAVRALAAQVIEGRLQLDECQEHDGLFQALCAIKGIGPWTAGYVAMRVARHPDAFIEGDWVVKKVMGATAAAARRNAERWRPWRAYAVMLLWWASAQGETCVIDT